MKTKFIICLFVIGASLANAQNENLPADKAGKKATVHIKKIENINGVEKVTDTTYTTDDPALVISDENTTIHEFKDKDGKTQKMMIVSSGDPNDGDSDNANAIAKTTINGSGNGRTVTRTVTNDNGKKTEKTVIVTVGDKMTPEEEKAFHEKIGRNIHSDFDENTGAYSYTSVNGNDAEGKVVIVKKSTCESSADGKNKTGYAYHVAIIKHINVKDPSDEDINHLGKPAGISDNKLDVGNMNFYPNPNNGKFTLSFDLKDKGNTTINIMNIEGKSVYSEELSNFTGNYNKEIDISSHPKGTYFVKIKQGSHAQLKKIILE
jgi:hypothetical protein